MYSSYSSAECLNTQFVYIKRCQQKYGRLHSPEPSMHAILHALEQKAPPGTKAPCRRALVVRGRFQGCINKAGTTDGVTRPTANLFYSSNNSTPQLCAGC